jgi:hypothetical protein
MIAAAILLSAAVADPIAGTWEGTSLCQVKPSPCHDEHALYRFTRGVGQHYKLDGYKIVGGKELFMGAIDLTFDPALKRLQGTIHGNRGDSHIRLDLKANHLSGRMTLADGTLFRLIEVDKH